MEENKVKNIVVLKNLPSNIVEEAIVVLKQNKIKLPEYSKKNENEPKGKEDSREYILKEAKMVISDYLNTIEEKKMIIAKKNNALEKKYKRLCLCTWGLGAALILMILL